MPKVNLIKPKPLHRKPKKVRPRGRPTAFKPEFCEDIDKLCMLGATDEMLAVWFKVDERTLNNWKQKYPDFFQSIKDAKLKHDTGVAKSLRDSAMGARWIEETAIKVKEVFYNKDGKKTKEVERVEVVPLQKSAPPHPKSVEVWLRNRSPKLWNEKIRIEEVNKKDSPLTEALATVGIDRMIALGDKLKILEEMEDKHVDDDPATGADTGNVPGIETPQP